MENIIHSQKAVNKAVNSLQREDLSEDMQLLADLAGIEVVRKITEHCGGLRFYVPKLTHNKQFIKRYINNNVNEENSRLALSLGISVSYVVKLKKQIIREGEKK